MDTSSLIDLLKIAATVGSVVCLYLFRRQILRIVTDIVIGGDSVPYKDETVSSLVESIDDKMERILR